MTTLTVCVGLPASGKSSWATAQVLSSGNVKRVNRDLLRQMFDGGWFSGENEAFVLETEEHLIRTLLGRGVDVICDDTNLDPSIRKRWLAVACDHDADYVEKSFLDVSRAECIYRDHKRKGLAHVGADVINRMHYKWLDGPRDS